MGTICFPEMLNKFDETFAVKELRMFKNETFFLLGAEGAYLWYFTVFTV